MPTVFLTLLLKPFTFVVTIDTTISLLLLLSYYCCCFLIVTTNKMCRVRYFPGAAEFTNCVVKAHKYLLAPLVSNQQICLYLPSKIVTIPYTCGSSHMRRCGGSIAPNGCRSTVLPAIVEVTIHQHVHLGLPCNAFDNGIVLRELLAPQDLIMSLSLAGFAGSRDFTVLFRGASVLKVPACALRR
jgi:hypothetical protein